MFDEDLMQTFLEYSETPIKTIKQRGLIRMRGVLRIQHTDQSKNNSKPLVQFLTAPDCGACDMLKRAVNKGTEARELLASFDVVHLHHDIRIMTKWVDKWHELGHEEYVPQVYFYSREGLPLDVVNPNQVRTYM